MSSTTNSPSWSGTSLYSGHSSDKQEETWCAAVHGAVESNCPNSCQQPMTAFRALPQGSDSSGHSSVCVSAFIQDKTCTLWFQILTNKPLKFHQLFLQRELSQPWSTTPLCSSKFQLRNKWAALLSHSRPKCNLEGLWEPSADLMGKTVFGVRWSLFSS